MKQTYVIGIDAGGTKVAYGLFDQEGNLLDRLQHPADICADGPAFSDTLISNIHGIMQKHAFGFDSLKGVGICMPSFILFEEGHVCLTSALTKIKDFPMRDYLQERLPTKIVLDNDGNAAALAEYRQGAGRGCRHMVYMATGTGIGSGLIIDGKLFRGSYGWAGECGHMLATPDEGVECGCENKGCFMSYAAGRYVPQHVQKRLDAGEPSLLADCEEIDCTCILDAYNKGDTLAIEIVKHMAHWIAVCAFNIYQLLNINTIVFGGGLVNFGDALFGRVREEFGRYNHIPQPVYFRFAELEKDFGIIGAAEFLKE